MKTKNFPANKLRRQMRAKEGRDPTQEEYENARSIRTKKDRRNKI